MTPDDPAAAVAEHLKALDRYMQAGARGDAAAAGALFMHAPGLAVPSLSDLADEFALHPERYAGYQSVTESSFVRVHVFGGSGSYWEERAVATYTSGKARVAYAHQIQNDGWKLYEVAFPNEPVP